MAVTVTTTAPSPSIDPIFAGSYGPSGSGKSVAVSTVGSSKQIRLTRLSLAGTYAGDFPLTPSEYGLSEIHGLAVVCGDSFGAAVPRLVQVGDSPSVGLYKADNDEVAVNDSVADFQYTVLLFGV